MEPIPPGAADLRAILEALPAGVALVVAPGTLAWANPAYFHATGRGPEFLGTDVRRLSDAEGTWSEPIRAAVEAGLERGTPSTFFGIRPKHRADESVYLDVEIRPLPGTPARVLLVARDVSAQHSERQRAVLFYEAFRTSTNPMQLTDARGVMIDVNPAFERVYGYSRAECIGRKPNLVRSRHTPPELYRQMWSDLQDPSRGSWSGEILNRDRSGRERPVVLSITAIRSARGEATHYLGVAVDLSEQRSWEMRAAHGDRLASLGQLAAGVAHEINTPLANVMLVAESVRRRSADPWVRSRIEVIAGQVDVAAGIVRGLLDFARQEAPHATELDLRDLARDGVAFVRGKQSADVDLVTELPADPVVVHGDRGQLLQVLTNLLNNAYDAMEGRGAVRVVVRARDRSGELEVADSGPGIPDAVMPHLFVPFFTTKPEGKGTGLGLAISHGIVQSHHGMISVRNAPGAGAVFVVALPLARTRDVPTAPASAESAPDGA